MKYYIFQKLISLLHEKCGTYLCMGGWVLVVRDTQRDELCMHFAMCQHTYNFRLFLNGLFSLLQRAPLNEHKFIMLLMYYKDMKE